MAEGRKRGERERESSGDPGPAFCKGPRMIQVSRGEWLGDIANSYIPSQVQKYQKRL